MIGTTLQAALCLCLSPLLVAQQTESTTEPRLSVATPPVLDPSKQAVPSSQTAVVTILKGTPLRLVARDSISTATLRVGSELRFAVADDVLIRGIRVIAAGTPLLATVTHLTAGSKKHHRDGRIKIRIQDVEVGKGVRIRFSGSPHLAPENLNRHRGPKAADVFRWILLAPLVVLDLPLLVLMGIAMSGEGGKPSGDDLNLSPCFHVTVYAASAKTVKASQLPGNAGSKSLSGQNMCSDSPDATSKWDRSLRFAAASGRFQIE